MAHVVLAYDGSPGAASAVTAVAGLFPGARVSVATVPRDPAVDVAAAVSMLTAVSETAVEDLFTGLDAEARREAAETARQAVEQAQALGLEADAADLRPAGPAWAALRDAAHRLDADVLVCGTRGRGAIARSLLGSTSTSLLHDTDLPLLVVPDGDPPLAGPVVVAYDGSPGSTHAIEVAGRLLGGRAAVVVHAWEPVFHRSLAAGALSTGAVDDVDATVRELGVALATRAAATMQEGVDAARAAGLDALGDCVEAGDGVWRAVAAAARGHGASAIVMGTRGLGPARSVLLGSVASSVVQNAERPVLVIPA